MEKRYLKGGEFLITPMEESEIFLREELPAEVLEIGATANRFMREKVVPNIKEIDGHNFDLLVSLIKEAGELGLFSIDVPEEYEGLGMDKKTSMYVAEQMGLEASFLTAYAAHTGIGILPLVYFGTKEQKEKYLTKLAYAEMIGAYCLSEPGAGTDAMNIKTKAVLSDDGKYYTVNGTKQFITNAGFADLFTVFAKVDGEHFTAFLVEKGTPGLSLGEEEDKMGIRGSSTRQVIFEDVKVPVENLLGEVGKGHKIAFGILNIGRYKLGTVCMGASKEIIGQATKYANERHQFGLPISKFGLIREKIAKIAYKTYAIESAIYRTAGLIDNEIESLDHEDPKVLDAIGEFAIEASITKIMGSEVLSYTVDEGLQIYGGYGYSEEYPMAKVYRDSKINRIFEGTNEINRVLIPAMLAKKAMKKELPLLEFESVIVDEIKSPMKQPRPAKGIVGNEVRYIELAKRVAMFLAGVGMKVFGDKIRKEEELLGVLADLSIGIFAAESAILRTRKLAEMNGEDKVKLHAVATQLYVNEFLGSMPMLAKKALNYMLEGPKLKESALGIKTFMPSYDINEVALQQELAKAVIEAEKYPF